MEISPKERRKQLEDKVKNKRKENKDKKFTSLSELNIKISKEVYEEWKKYR